MWRWTRPCDLVPFLLRTTPGPFAGAAAVARPASTTQTITTTTRYTTNALRLPHLVPLAARYPHTANHLPALIARLHVDELPAEFPRLRW